MMGISGFTGLFAPHPDPLPRGERGQLPRLPSPYQGEGLGVRVPRPPGFTGLFAPHPDPLPRGERGQIARLPSPCQGEGPGVRVLLLVLLLLASAMGAGAVIYVDADAAGPAHDGASWTTAFQTIQQGIDAAEAAGGPVWVAAGLYPEHVTLRSGVEVYGGFAGGETALEQRDWENRRTIIDAGGAGRAVVGANGARIDGFTLTNGRASYGAGVLCWATSPTIANCTIINNHTAGYGGGLYISQYSAAHIVNCRILNNSARDGGGAAVYVHSSPTFDYCRVSGNTGNWGAGLLFADNTNPTVRSCEITDNRGDAACFGGGIHLLHNTGTITDCLIARNSTPLQGGGIYGYDTTARIERNLICDNRAGAAGGGISLRYSSPVIANNLLRGNLASSGGAIEIADSSVVQLVHNTIAANHATGRGGGVYCRLGGSAGLVSCILAFNAAPSGGGVFVEPGSSCSLSHCGVHESDLSGVAPGQGCVAGNPQFLAWHLGEMHLAAGSPCIDAGASPAPLSVDMDSNPRSVDGSGDGTTAPDIGCYEYAAGPIRVWSVGQAKALPDDTLVRLVRKRVSGCFERFFYLQEADRSSGIRVTGGSPAGTTVDTVGRLTTVNGERMVQQSDL